MNESGAVVAVVRRVGDLCRPAIAPSVPCAGPSTTDSVRASSSPSLQLSWISVAAPAGAVFATGSQVGAVFGGAITVIETVAAAEVAVPSVAR